jgi:hypothetical protein
LRVALGMAVVYQITSYLIAMVGALASASPCGERPTGVVPKRRSSERSKSSD